MSVWKYHVVFLSCLVTGSCVTLENLTSTDVYENGKIEFKCLPSINASAENAWWKIGNLSAITLWENGVCNATGYLTNETAYGYDCLENNTFTIQLKNVSHDLDGTNVSCRFGFESSKDITIHVKVPVYSVKMDQNDTSITVPENETITFTCRTAHSRPEAYITWFIQDLSFTSALNITSSSNQTTDDIINGVISSKSELSIKPNRSVNGSKIYCSATNVPEQSVQSSKITLNVLYPPDGPPKISRKTNNDTYTLIEGKIWNLSCYITGGNPVPTLSWDCSNSSIFHKENATTVRSTVTWTTQRDQNSCSCFSHHRMRNQSVTQNFTVLYPPSKPILTIGNIFVPDVINVIRYKGLNVSCSSNGNPTPNYSWSENDTSTQLKINGRELYIDNMTADGHFFCEVTNVMKDSANNSEKGINTRSLHVEVLFSASISKIPDRSIVEGLSLNISCPVISGNTNFTSVYWSRDNDTMQQNQTELFMSNITRMDAQIYTCTVKSGLYPTFGNEKIDYTKQSFYLNVFYKASVKRFLLNDLENKTHLANQSTRVNFTCEIDSNPNSTVNLTFPNGTSHSKPGTKFLKYSLLLTSCNDSGAYTCSGSNNYSVEQPGISLIQLLVNCHPIPDGDFPREKRSKLNVPVTLHFKTLAYPMPFFTWEIWTDTSWQSVTNNTKFTVSTLKLQTSLTISNFTVKQNEFRVNVTNFIGTLVQYFTVLPFDRPAKPSNFSYLLLTDTHIILSWNPGFNGGIPQNFFIEYESENNYNRTTLIVNDTEEQQMNLTIEGLNSSTFYKFQIFAVNSQGRSDTSAFNVTTKASETTEVSQEPNAPTGMIVGSTIGVIAGGIVFGVLIFRRYLVKKKTEGGKRLYQNVPFSSVNKPRSDKTKAKKETSFHPLQELDDTPPEYNEPTEYYNSPEKIEQMKKIRVPELLQYVSDRTEEAFAAEYQKLPTGLHKPCTFARKPENIAMNRYNGIYPYDHSRVKLPGQPDFFINASYIHGYARQNAYIASLGPTKKVTDNYRTFWTMVWSEQSDIIVMLTNLQEPSGMKCEQYWPDSGTSKMCGDIQVTCDREDVNAEYTARLLNVSNAHEQRNVTHLHYTAWPDKKVPEDLTTLIEFRERIKATPSTKKGPMIVHCSAGVGRTGTLIALDRLIEEGQCESTVDVFKCVDDMREQRVKMVQTQEQYIYIYKALVNRLYFDCEMIPVESFQEYVSTTNNNIYSKQFQQLKESVETFSKEERDARAANQLLVHKNRLGADIPGDQNRVRMYLNRQTDESDYINAVYVHSFKKKDHFISAQSPLPETVSDFLCMLYQENCCCVVTMEDLQEPGLAFGRYLPSGGRTLKVGRFEVSCTTLERKAQYTVREMKIKHNGQYKSGEKAVYHFQYNKWVSRSDVPSDPKEFMQFIQDVKDYSDQLGEENSHVLVHCLRANERSGLYCIVAILMEKIRYERQVSVLNTVRHFRTRRRTALTSMEQLKFCYNAVSAYISMYES